MEASVVFSRSSDSTSINMSRIDQKPGVGVPNPTAIENDNVKGQDLSDEGTSFWLYFI